MIMHFIPVPPLRVRQSPAGCQAGFALPLVLGMIMLITVIIFSISETVSHRIGLTTDLDNQVRAELKLYSAYNQVLFTILTATFTPTGLNIRPATQADDMAFATETRMPVGQFWNLYNQEIKIEPEVSVQLQDLGGLISPLWASEVLRDVFTVLLGDMDQASQAVDGLADWQDADDFRRLHGAEAWDYRAAGRDYAPRNTYIQSLDELALIKGFDQALLNQIGPVMSYYPSGNLNYLTMPEDLLRAFLRDDTQVARVLELRQADSLTPALFTAITGVAATEDNFLHPSGQIRIEIKARHDSAGDRLVAVIAKRQTSQQPFTILKWQR